MSSSDPDVNSQSAGPSFLRSRTLRVDILTAFVGLLLATVLAIAAFTHHHNRQAILDLSGDLIAQATDVTLEKTAAYLEPAAAMAELCARVAAETLASGGDLRELETYAIRTVRSYPQFAMVNIGDERGNFLMPKKLPDGTVATKIINRTGSPPSVVWKYRDAAGRVVRSKTSAEIDYDPRGRAWYTGAKKAGDGYWTDTYVLFTDRRPGIAASFPILADDGTFLGAVGIDIELGSLSGFLAELKIGKSGLAFILDAAGDVVAYPGAASVVVEGPDGLRPARIQELSASWVAASLDEYARTRETSFTFTHGDKRYLASYTPLPATLGRDWKVAVVVPEADFTGPLRDADRGVMLLLVLTLLVAVLATTFIARGISQPIAKLSQETARIRNFDLSGEATVVSSIREIQLMEDSIGAMKTGLRSFQKYVPEALVRQLVETGEDARLGGQLRELTLMFSDVNDFTGRSERLSPQELMVHLSEYLDELTREIIRYGGTVDKYIGDGIMAFWGAPLHDVEHAANACRAALACQSRVRRLNKAWEAEGKTPFPTRLGIHTGPTVVGNVGSAERMNYSAVGDSVNLASRLEAVNKIYGTSVIISEATLVSAGEGFICRPLGIVAVKGKQEGVKVLELLCEAVDSSAGEAEDLARRFSEALELYLGRDWEQAAHAFEALGAELPSDGPTAAYLQWCRELLQRPPEEAWDGVLRLEHK